MVSVLAGDTFDRVGDDEYVMLAEPIPEGYATLLRDLEASGRSPDRILHAWLVTDEETFRPGSSFLHRNLEQGFFSLRCLQQALVARPGPGPLHLTMLATGMQRVGDEPLPYPEKAAALGHLIALPGELPGLTWSAVDVTLPSRQKGLLGGMAPSPRSLLHALAARRAPAGDDVDDDVVNVALVDALRAEVLGPARDQIVALRGGARWVRGDEPLKLEGRPAQTGFKERGVYLVTGGLEGAAATLTRTLAKRHRARLVLIDPAPQPDHGGAEAWMERHPHDRAAARVRRALELEALGAEVMTAAAEVTDVSRLRDVVLAAEARFGRIDGVIHGEGPSRADPVASGSMAEVAGIFAPRIHGTLALADVLRDRPLDFFVTWSPVGTADVDGGQANEAAAAAFLDAFAEVKHDWRVVALAWDASVGAAPGVDTDDEFDALERAVRSFKSGSVVASSVDPHRRQAPARPAVAVVVETPEAPPRRLAHPEPVRTPRGSDIRREAARHMYLVRMHPGSELAKPPLFLVAGLFGNVLNLRYLAQILGAERPVYGLQARGLFGGHEPHETFEAMARDYLVELRTVQPHGPYLLGGFSGGGITAYEMARQLMEAGEVVQLVVLLDTPVPRREQLSAADRASIHFQNLQRQGPGYVRRWLEHKIEHRLRLQRRAERLRAQRGGESRDFRSQVIEAAFYRALAQYQMPSLPISVALFRPKIDPTYRLSRGRMLSADRSALYPDNGWTRYVENLDIQEVPGNHDGMVLEPHVRVLAARIEAAMARASASAVTPARAAKEAG
ncbi:MAG: hypothetical protein QOI66_2499 [Myxococcales bacterium]|nr:hypothetical protein [Myxococcales bacterium]